MLKRSLFISTFWIVLFVLWALPALSEVIVDTAWVRRYNGYGNGWDVAVGIGVDGFGNVYVTGWTVDAGSLVNRTTIKYYPNGDTAWVRRYVGSGNDGPIAIDGSGNVYVTGSSNWPPDYVTVKYYSNGDTAWVRRYSGVGQDEPTAIAVDGSGNVYVTGWSLGTNGDFNSWDYATVKYDQNGNELWVRRYDGPNNYDDEAWDIALDESGNVYVTGSSGVSLYYWDYLTIKYYPDGDTAWVRRYNSPSNQIDRAVAIAVDDSGNVYVTGFSYGSGTGNDYSTIKYYPTGDTAWVRRYNGPGNSGDVVEGIAVDGSGNVYVTGESYGSGTDLDYATIKYYPNGDTAWVRRYDGPANGVDVARAIAVDRTSNVYVTGSSLGRMGDGDSWDFATIKHDSSGNVVWVERYNGPADSMDEARVIAVDNSGNVYVTGNSYGSGSSQDYTTIKYFQALRGDVNRDGVINVADVVYMINYLFTGGPTPVPILQVGDVNCDTVINVADVVYLINYLFIGGPPPDC